MNITESTADKALPKILQELLRSAVQPSRNGATKETLFARIELTNPCERYISSPGRKASLPAQIAETMWVLAGRSDVEWLSHYLPRAKDFSDNGEVWRGAYGPRIRKWGGFPHQDKEGRAGFDQLKHVVDLLKEDPATRRAVINIYDPSVDSRPGKDIPCNNWLHFLARDGLLNLHVATRSNDAMWGWSGINAFEWSTILEIVAAATGFQVGSLIFSISSLHLYENHFKKAERIVEQERNRTWALDPSPRFRMPSGWKLDELLALWFKAEDAIRNGRPDMEMRIKSFPEPMFQAWLKVLAYHWTGDAAHYHPRDYLRAAMLESPKRKAPEPEQPTENLSALTKFKTFVLNLHREKNAAYGDSWKSRGENVSILANIARKVDRLLAGTETSDENELDTAIDLWVYCAKYAVWLEEKINKTEGWEEELEAVEERLTQTEFTGIRDVAAVKKAMGVSFEGIISHASDPKTANYFTERFRLLMTLETWAGAYAHHLWWKKGNQERVWKGYDK